MADIMGIDLILVILFLGGVFPIIVLVINDALILRKGLVIFFESENIARVVRANAVDGVLSIDNKSYFIDKAKKVIIKIGFIIKGFVPLYVIKNNHLASMEFTDKGIKDKLDPESAQAKIRNKTLVTFLSMHQEIGSMLLFIGVGIVIGGLAGYIMGIGALSG